MYRVKQGKNPKRWFLHYLSHLFRHAIEQAKEQYEQAHLKYPNSAKYFVNKGGILLSQGKFLEAIDHFEKAIEINPNHFMAISNKGMSHQDHILIILSYQKQKNMKRLYFILINYQLKVHRRNFVFKKVINKRYLAFALFYQSKYQEAQTFCDLAENLGFDQDLTRQLRKMTQQILNGQQIKSL